MSNEDTRHDQTQPAQPQTTTPTGDMSLALIEEQADRTIRRVWHEGQWFFSVIDVVGVLTDAPTPRMYWADMKRNIQSEDFQKLLMRCRQLKLPATDGKLRETDCADFATLVALIHALPALRRRRDHISPDNNIGSSNCGIYAIVNAHTQEQYIGSSADIPKRFAQHKALLRRGKHHASRLQDAWDIYGEEAFAFVVVETLPDNEQLEEIEQRYLDEMLPVYNGATTATNMAALPPISAERIHHLLLALYNIQRTSMPTPLFDSLREALIYGIVTPGPNFHLLGQAEANDVATWEAFAAFRQQQSAETQREVSCVSF